MSDITLGEGFHEQERERIADLYWEAFGRKLRPGFADDATGRAVVGRALRSDRMLVARRSGEVVGICGFRRAGSGAADLRWSRLRASLSVAASLRALLVLSVLSRSEQHDALTLDGICVDRQARGGGIGSALLRAAADRARHLGAASVRLSVVDDNPRARALYERHGYRPVDRGALGVLAPVYGFDGYTTMEREVSG